MKDIGIILKFDDRVSPGKLEKAINKVLEEYGPQNEEVVPGSFYTSSSFISFEAYEISFDFLGELYLALCKAVISYLPAASFYGYSHYADEDADFGGYYVYEYSGKTLAGRMFTCKSSYDGSCPFCGDQIIDPEEYEEGEAYECDGCGKLVDLAAEFDIKFTDLGETKF